MFFVQEENKTFLDLAELVEYFRCSIEQGKCKHLTLIIFKQKYFLNGLKVFTLCQKIILDTPVCLY